MTMEHKAYVFDYAAFERELRPILEQALTTSDCRGLVAFIEANHDELTDPYEGEPLGDGWLDLVETADAHQYGDFALTKYYDVLEDCGLGGNWTEAQDAAPVTTAGNSPLLGHTVGPAETPFDPGKQGSYFQGPSELAESKDIVVRGARAPWRGAVVAMLDEALAAGKGLYVTL
jgi:hypothetical protein